MNSFVVSYSIEVDAPSPQAAAVEVWKIIRDPESLPPILTVICVGDGQKAEVIDLMLTDEAPKHAHGFDPTRGAWQCNTCDTAIEDCSAL